MIIINLLFKLHLNRYKLSHKVLFKLLEVLAWHNYSLFINYLNYNIIRPNTRPYCSNLNRYELSKLQKISVWHNYLLFVNYLNYIIILPNTPYCRIRTFYFSFVSLLLFLTKVERKHKKVYHVIESNLYVMWGHLNSFSWSCCLVPNTNNIAPWITHFIYVMIYLWWKGAPL